MRSLVWSFTAKGGGPTRWNRTNTTTDEPVFHLAVAFSAMRFNLLVGLSVEVALGVIWLITGRHLTMFLDRFLAVSVASVDVHRLQYDGGGLRIGEFPTTLSMTFGAIDNQIFDVTLCSDTSNMVVLRSRGRDFTLGPRTNPPDPSGKPDIYFIPEQGDALTFTVTRSIMIWPTPFEFSILTRTPWWKRYVYYRLIWKKRSGAQLAMLWRYEQDYFAVRGWTEPAMLWNLQTGAVRVDIRSYIGGLRPSA